jgi:hypothetical protein
MLSFYRIASISFLLMLLGGMKMNAQEENFIAASIYNFTRNIDWPSNNANGDFIVDIIGHKSVYEKLKELVAGHKVGNRTIVVRFLESVNNITQSQILFVGFWQSKDMSRAIEKVGSSATLVVSEKDGLIDSGTGINFVIRNGSLKFEIKKANIQKYGLSVGMTLEQMAFKAY